MIPKEPTDLVGLAKTHLTPFLECYAKRSSNLSFLHKTPLSVVSTCVSVAHKKHPCPREFFPTVISFRGRSHFQKQVCSLGVLSCNNILSCRQSLRHRHRRCFLSSLYVSLSSLYVSYHCSHDNLTQDFALCRLYTCPTTAHLTNTCSFKRRAMALRLSASQ